MAHDEGLAQCLRGSLAGVAGISEKRMFGGRCFLLDGNMLCGVHRDWAMFRVGREAEGAALAIPGAAAMRFTGRPMA
ncbi:MAG TPA: TfoX/Sxy family protein, partial [Paracoccaceae bacterium]|nr:TfoX/Sxy family protein [Paracoccaceae bacterium]